MSMRIGAWAAIGATGVVAAVLLGFWLVAGLEPAGWLAGVISAFLALFLAAMALLDRARSPRPQQESDRSAHAETANRVDGGAFAGPVVMGRDIGPGRADSDASTGSVSNTFSGGVAQGPVVMGRNISGETVQGPMTSAPLPPPDESETRES